MKWGLLSGLGDGLKFTSAAMYEQAKAQELERIRKQERVEDRADAVADREARMADAKTLSDYERDNAGKWEEVLDEKTGKVIAERNTVTGQTRPLNLDQADNRMSQMAAYLVKTDRDLLDPVGMEEYDQISALHRKMLLDNPGGASGGTEDPNSDDDVLDRTRKEQAEKAQQQGGGTPGYAGSRTSDLLFGARDDGKMGGLIGGFLGRNNRGESDRERIDKKMQVWDQRDWKSNDEDKQDRGKRMFPGF